MLKTKKWNVTVSALCASSPQDHHELAGEAVAAAAAAEHAVRVADPVPQLPPGGVSLLQHRPGRTEEPAQVDGHRICKSPGPGNDSGDEVQIFWHTTEQGSQGTFKSLEI